MKVIESEMVVMYDVDDTLVKWSDKHTQPHDNAIEFIDPYDGASLFLKKHQKHINLLKQHKARGYTVIVWSGGGYRWAETVINTLGLSIHVDVVMSKCMKFVDDLPAEEVLGSRIYLEDK